MTPSRQSGVYSLLLVVMRLALVSSGTQFSSHVTVNTPARSYSHGVGHPLPSNGRRSYQRSNRLPYGKRVNVNNQRSNGYPKIKPTIPFTSEERSIWLQNGFDESPITLLPPSPYKVDSADPESLWPEGLFLPPLRPPATSNNRRASSRQRSRSYIFSKFDMEPEDPYLLEGSNARAAVRRASDHGLYYFHDIPHIESLLENQQLRIDNNLEPHRLGSIRHTWPYNRP